MKILFIHQNFPAQYKHIAPAMASDKTNQVVAIGERRRQLREIKGVRHIWYEPPNQGGEGTHSFLRGFDSQVRRGEVVLKVLLRLKNSGFIPDLVCVHPGWGEGLFVREVFPDVPILCYFEFFYHPRGVDVGFDPEFTSTVMNEARVRLKNALNLLSLNLCNRGLCPTFWQKSLFPEEYRSKIEVIHDGIDTDLLRPRKGVRIRIQSAEVEIGSEDEIITFVNRNLEPYRGFHVFMRALPAILERRPRARVLIVGGDEVSYGSRLPGGDSYKSKYIKEVGLNSDRVHFLGRVPYRQFVALLQISSLHIYLTYPFVLSWSMLEAMSCGALVLASSTPPVTEVIEDGINGMLVDFFDTESLVRRVYELLEAGESLQGIKDKARETVVERYDLKTRSLPAQIELLKNMAFLRLENQV